MLNRDDSSSFLGISDDMITIEDTYKESEIKKEVPKQDNPTNNNYLITQLEMNVIEEQADEEDKS